MTRWNSAACLVALAVVSAACTSTPQAQAQTKATPTPTMAPVTVSTTPTAPGLDEPLTVDKVGASASPSGFIAFALISNPSSRAAAHVVVQISAVTASGAELAHSSGTIARIAPSQTQAVAVRIPATPPTPTAFKASITGNDWLDPGAQAEPVEVTEASFVQDPRTPTVRVRVANHATLAQKVSIIAVCVDSAGALRGGGTGGANVAASSNGQDTWVPVSIPVIPTSCQGYAQAE